MPLPKEPILFFKSTTALSGPKDDLIIPKKSIKTDWEVELAVVMGKKASYVEEKDAMDYVAGFCLHNDYSEREFQLERNGQWVREKAAIPSHQWGHIWSHRMILQIIIIFICGSKSMERPCRIIILMI